MQTAFRCRRTASVGPALPAAHWEGPALGSSGQPGNCRTADDAIESVQMITDASHSGPKSRHFFSAVLTTAIISASLLEKRDPVGCGISRKMNTRLTFRVFFLSPLAFGQRLPCRLSFFIIMSRCRIVCFSLES